MSALVLLVTKLTSKFASDCLKSERKSVGKSHTSSAKSCSEEGKVGEMEE